jgi:shikimate 5-dehydrogenase
MEKKFGLIGATVSHSFSKAYFDEKFFQDGLRDYHYDLYPLKSIDDLTDLLKENPELCGLNVTIPYKEQVIKFLSDMDAAAKSIGAVNVIKIQKGKLTGYNTDSDAFLETVEKWFANKKGSQALILGTGGSSKSVRVALAKLNIAFKTVSTTSRSDRTISSTTLYTIPRAPCSFKRPRSAARQSRTVLKCSTSRLRNHGKSGITRLLGPRCLNLSACSKKINTCHGYHRLSRTFHPCNPCLTDRQAWPTKPR